jgi:hypothetical protein
LGAELLDYVEKVVSDFALERILGTAELGGVDPEVLLALEVDVQRCACGV